jgi:hypothetical protein
MERDITDPSSVSLLVSLILLFAYPFPDPFYAERSEKRGGHLWGMSFFLDVKQMAWAVSVFG